MDYEKLYNDALENAKGIINYYKEHNRGDEAAIEDIEIIFPELKESEDEKIRKWLICGMNALKEQKNETFATIPIDDAIAWLEKQKSVGEIVERCKNSWYNEGKIAGQFEGITDDEKYQQGWHDALEKQGEKKPTWSDEDEEYMSDVIAFLEDARDCRQNALDCIEWMKQLKERLS